MYMAQEIKRRKKWENMEEMLKASIARTRKRRKQKGRWKRNRLITSALKFSIVAVWPAHKRRG